MAGYTKLFSSLITSTIWREDPATCKVWITMLALANKHGEVEASIPGLADMARVSREQCESALSLFLRPDPDSRTQEMDGRRIVAIDGGWALVNHAKYRALANKDDMLAKSAARQARWRERNKLLSNADVTPRNAGVTKSNDIAEAEAEAEAETTTTARAKENEAPTLPFHSPAFETAWTAWTAHRREIRHALTPRSGRMQLAQCLGWGEARAIAAIEHSIAQGYRGLFEPHGNGPQRQTVQPAQAGEHVDWEGER